MIKSDFNLETEKILILGRAKLSKAVVPCSSSKLTGRYWGEERAPLNLLGSSTVGVQIPRRRSLTKRR